MNSSQNWIIYVMYAIVDATGHLVHAICAKDNHNWGEYTQNVLERIKSFVFDNMACKLALLYYIWMTILLFVYIAIGGVVFMLVMSWLLVQMGLTTLFRATFTLPKKDLNLPLVAAVASN